MQGLGILTDCSHYALHSSDMGRRATMRRADDRQFLRAKAERLINTVRNDSESLKWLQRRAPECGRLRITERYVTISGRESHGRAYTVPRFHDATA